MASDYDSTISSLEHIITVMRENPSSLADALDVIAGRVEPDLMFVSPDERSNRVEELAISLGLSTSELMLASAAVRNARDK